MEFDEQIFRSHMVGKLIPKLKTLTVKQIETFNALQIKKDLGKITEKQLQSYYTLQSKNGNEKVALNYTAKSELIDIFYQVKYGRRKKLSNKYFGKGGVVENESRDLLSEVIGVFLTKDDERRSNKWVTGQRDIKHDVILDIKSSYSFETFTNIINKPIDDIYANQLDCYMELWDSKESAICYCLIDTPFNLVDDDVRRYLYQNNGITIEGDIMEHHIEAVVQIVNNLIFTEKALKEYCQISGNVYIEWFEGFIEIPPYERVHIVKHDFDKSRIERRNEYISLSREYLNKLNGIKNNIIL